MQAILIGIKDRPALRVKFSGALNFIRSFVVIESTASVNGFNIGLTSFNERTSRGMSQQHIAIETNYENKLLSEYYL